MDNKKQNVKVTKVTPEDGFVSGKVVRPMEKDPTKRLSHFKGNATNVTFYAKDLRKGKAFLIFIGAVFSVAGLILMLRGHIIFGLVLLAVIIPMVVCEIRDIHREAKKTGTQVPQTPREVIQAGKDLVDDIQNSTTYACKNTFTEDAFRHTGKIGLVFYLVCCTFAVFMMWLAGGFALAIPCALVMVIGGIAFFALLKLLVKIFQKK